VTYQNVLNILASSKHETANKTSSNSIRLFLNYLTLYEFADCSRLLGKWSMWK